MKFGIIGLGKMGMALAKHALREKFELVAYNRSPEKVDDIAKEGTLRQAQGKLIPAYSLSELVEKLEKPRIVWLMVSAGKPTEEVLFGKKDITSRARYKTESADYGLYNLLSAGDIVIDAVNSHYKDSIRRGRVLLEKGIQFLDVGTSGGVEGALNGACFMIGGPEAAFKKCEPIFKALAQVDGYAYFGKSGSGHFVKMVHNGIEYAMMQALGEGMDILDKSEFDIDLYSTAKVWNHGSVIESRLVDWLQKAIKEDPGLKKSPAEIGSLGTGKWAVEEALELGVPATTIAHAVFTRYQSRNFEALAFKVVQALRARFGGHTPGERPA